MTIDKTSSASFSCEKASVLRQIRDQISGFSFDPNASIFGSQLDDYKSAHCLLGQGREEDFKRVPQRISQLLLHAYKNRHSLQRGSMRCFWTGISESIGHASGNHVSGRSCQRIVLAMLKGRQRFLIQNPDRKDDDVDLLVTAYAQLLLSHLIVLDNSMNGTFDSSWKLSRRDTVRAMRPKPLLGPSKQLSKNRFQLSTKAPQLLHPIADLTSVGKYKPDIMGLARSIATEDATEGSHSIDRRQSVSDSNPSLRTNETSKKHNSCLLRTPSPTRDCMLPTPTPSPDVPMFTSQKRQTDETELELPAKRKKLNETAIKFNRVWKQQIAAPLRHRKGYIPPRN